MFPEACCLLDFSSLVPITDNPIPFDLKTLRTSMATSIVLV